MNKTVLLIDMDGVLTDWYLGILEKIQARYPMAPLLRHNQIKTFYIEDNYPEEWGPAIREIMKDAKHYHNLVPIPGGVEALKDIEANCLDFIEPFIVTAPDLETEGQECWSGKALWVQEHLGDWWLKRLVITKDKTLVRGHFLIDDKPKIAGAMKPNWTQLIYTQPYNSEVVGQHFTWEKWPVLKRTLKGEIPGFSSVHKSV